MSKASELAELFTTRLQGVPGVINVFRGKRKIEPEELPCIVLFEGEDRITDETTENTALVDQFYGAEWHGPAVDVNNPNDTAHTAIAEMKKALFIRRDPMRPKMFRKLRYKGRSIGTREEGSEFVSAIVLFSAEVGEELTNP